MRSRKGASPRDRDRLREASRRLRLVLNTSRKLSVDVADLGALRGVRRLRAACGHDTPPWIALAAVLAIVATVLLASYQGLADVLTCPANNTKDLQVRTVRSDRLKVEVEVKDPEKETSPFNGSEDQDKNEDQEEDRRWPVSQRRLR